MPFIPHTDDDISSMLDAIGVASIEALFDEIPKELMIDELKSIPSGLNEMELARHIQRRAEQTQKPLCFIGAGAYEHYIPAAVWDITSRGEFMTAYTPYQAEASQGTLQLIYEYQTMMANLTAMDISNASLYDGATALAESVLMAQRSQRKNKSRRVLIPKTCHPHYRQVLKTIVSNQNIEIIELPFDEKTGITNENKLNEFAGDGFSILVIPQPNFFGCLENIDTLTDWAHHHNALVIGVVNPTSLSLLKPPGQWGETGADIVCGEGQPLGVPLASGGPYFGFLCCKKELIRQMPGRLVGRSHDQDNKTCFTLTLQAREQHIRRAKATSNICTNQGLLVTAATIYLSLMGPHGLKRVAVQSHKNIVTLAKQFKNIDGIETIFSRPSFHEMVIRLNKPVDDILKKLAHIGILGGYPLEKAYPELKNCLLICTTETKTEDDLLHFVTHLKNILSGKYDDITHSFITNGKATDHYLTS